MISQVNIYVIDIVWILYDVCVEVKIHGFFCKVSLRICYVSLLECNGPLMLKTYKLPCVEQKITKTRLKKYHIQRC